MTSAAELRLPAHQLAFTSNLQQLFGPCQAAAAGLCGRPAFLTASQHPATCTGRLVVAPTLIQSVRAASQTTATVPTRDQCRPLHRPGAPLKPGSWSYSHRRVCDCVQHLCIHCMHCPAPAQRVLELSPPISSQMDVGIYPPAPYYLGRFSCALASAVRHTASRPAQLTVSVQEWTHLGGVRCRRARPEADQPGELTSATLLAVPAVRS